MVSFNAGLVFLCYYVIHLQLCSTNQNIFPILFPVYFMVINDSILCEILDSLDNSMKNLVFLHLHEHKDWLSLKNFLDQQYEILLENLLNEKSTAIHHLESGMKNRIMIRKQELFTLIQHDFNQS
jgi:hypothetical protein